MIWTYSMALCLQERSQSLTFCRLICYLPRTPKYSQMKVFQSCKTSPMNMSLSWRLIGTRQGKTKWLWLGCHILVIASMKARASFFLTTSLLPGKQMPTTCNNYIVYVPTRTLLFGVALLTATTSTSKSSVDSKSSPFRMSRNNPGGRTQEKYSIIWSTSTKLAFNCQTSRIIRSI